MSVIDSQNFAEKKKQLTYNGFGVTYNPYTVKFGVNSTSVDALQENIKCTSDQSGALYPSTTCSPSAPPPYYATYPQPGEYAPRLGAYSSTQWAPVDGVSNAVPPSTKSSSSSSTTSSASTPPISSATPQSSVAAAAAASANHKDYLQTQFTMSGGPPPNQHPHTRQAPPNSAWNHLQVPNYYPTGRQPQHAHMSSELPMLASHQPTWHTPTTTEPSKGLPAHNPLFNLQQMLSTERPFARHSPGVDLSLAARNGNQNGDVPAPPPTPISLSVRDAKQINSLPVGAALDGDRAVELTKGARQHTTTLNSTQALLNNDMRLCSGPSPGLHDAPKSLRKPTRRVDSILERLNTSNTTNTATSATTTATPPAAVVSAPSNNPPPVVNTTTAAPPPSLAIATNDKPATQSSVIVTAAASSSHDENSNSSQGTAAASVPTPTPAPLRDDELASPVSNEDSLDSNKSRRKRKPSKTMKVAKEEESGTGPTDGSGALAAAAAAAVAAAAATMVANASVHIAPHVSQPPEKETTPVLPINQHPPTEIPVAVVSESGGSAPGTDVPVESSPARRRSSSEPPSSPPAPTTTRRKTVSESETIDNIAAMVAATSRNEVSPPREEEEEEEEDTGGSPASHHHDSTGPDHGEMAAGINDSSNTGTDNIPNSKPVSVITRDHCNCSSDSVTHPADLVGEPTSDIDGLPEAAAAPQLITLAQKKAGDTQCFVAVEDELEKMFAGIGDNDTPETDPLAIASTSHNVDSVSSTCMDMAGTSKSALHKRGRPKVGAKGSRRPSESNSTESTPRKKHKGNKKSDMDESGLKVSPVASKAKKKKGGSVATKLQLNNRPDVVKDVYSYDSGSNASSSRSKGPFIQIKGPRDSPISVSIVNTPSHEDDPDKPAKQLKGKKFHDDSEYRHKVRSKGLHCSTLSNKYDAQTRDASWVCVFCKRGPHATDPLLPGPSPFTLDAPAYSPGDLFGPYIITSDCPEFQRRLDDPFDALFKSKKSASAAASSPEVKPMKKSSKSKRNSESGEPSADLKDVMLGIAEVSTNSYEVWVHEDCVIWGPGVYLVGPKIMGLEGAVWGACSVACRRCGLRGAAVCCLRRGCGAVMHIGCAKLSHWTLDEENYKAYCTAHAPP